MVEHEIKNKVELLNSDGTLNEEGFARKPYFLYDRSKIKASKLRIKEWDYYAILDPVEENVICMTFSDLGFAGLFALALIDYKNKRAIQKDQIKYFTMHKTGLIGSPWDDNTIVFSDKKFSFSFTKEGETRHIVVKSEDINIDSCFFQGESKETINIATSWKENRRAFYLNEKAVAMTPISGYVQIKGNRYDVKSNKMTLILDWGRGRWTRENTWYWAAASGFDEFNNPIGFNLGYGFSDRTPASENAFFLADKLHKIKNVTFNFESHMKEWIMKDDEGRLNLTFTPVVPRISKTDLKIIVSDQKQIFGYFDGFVILEDGTKKEIHHLMGFAEEVYNKW